MNTIAKWMDEREELQKARMRRLKNSRSDLASVLVREEFGRAEKENSMALPLRSEELEKLGYSKLEKGDHCKACGVAIEWWRTPKHKLMPMTVELKDGVEIRISHFANCPAADEFRRHGGRAYSQSA